MKFNFFSVVLVAIFAGYFMSNFLFSNFGDLVYGEELASTYFLKCEDCTDKFINYLVDENSSNNSIYVGMTSSKDNLEKIINYYKKIGISINYEEKSVDNSLFNTELNQYDVLIKNCKNTKEMNSVLSSIVSTYEEVVLNED